MFEKVHSQPPKVILASRLLAHECLMMEAQRRHDRRYVPPAWCRSMRSIAEYNEALITARGEETTPCAIASTKASLREAGKHEPFLGIFCHPKLRHSIQHSITKPKIQLQWPN